MQYMAHMQIVQIAQRVFWSRVLMCIYTRAHAYKLYMAAEARQRAHPGFRAILAGFALFNEPPPPVLLKLMMIRPRPSAAMRLYNTMWERKRATRVVYNVGPCQ